MNTNNGVSLKCEAFDNFAALGHNMAYFLQFLESSIDSIKSVISRHVSTFLFCSSRYPVFHIYSVCICPPTYLSVLFHSETYLLSNWVHM